MAERALCRIALALCLCSMSWLAGCGGGGSTPPPPPPPPPMTPSIASLSPSSIVAGGPDFTLTVNGSNFVSASTVQFNGNGRSTTFVSASQLQATISASDITLGAVNTVTVSNPAGSGGTSSGFTFTVNNPLPATTAVTPNFIPEGSNGLTLTIAGSGFLPISTVQLNGSPRPTTFVSNAALKVAITAADVATTSADSVVVSNPVPGGGTSNPQSFTVTIPPPIITRITPSSAVKGGGDFTVTITGSGFTSGATVQFNGSPRTTTFVSHTQLQAQITAADIATVGLSNITVANSITTTLNAAQSVNGPTSAPSTFFTGSIGGPGFAAVTINQSAQDLVFDPAHQFIYLSVPGSAATNPNSISVVDVATAALTTSAPAGSNPRVLAISDDSQFLYAGIDGANIVQRFTLPALSKDISYPLGSDFFGNFVALDLQVAPGAPHTTAVALGSPGTSPEAEGGITIFDDATARPTKAPGFSGTGNIFASIQWGANVNKLFAANNEDTGFDFYTLSVNANGVTLNQDFKGVFDSFANTIHFDPGTKLVYGDEGHALFPNAGSFAGRFDLSGSNVMVTDSNLNAAYFANSNGPGITITSFDLTHFTQAGQISVPVSGSPVHLIRWGQDGLAFNTSTNQVVLLAGNFLDPVVTPAAVPPPNITPPPPPPPTAQTPTIASLVPSATVAGGPAFTLTVNGTQFDPAAQVLFNGSPRTTNFVSSTQLTATINAADIANVGTANIAVANPVANGGTSSPSTFFTGTTAGTGFVTTVLNQQAKDIVYDPLRQAIYLSVPGSAATNANTISVLELSTATIPFFQFAGSDPNLLSISGDSQFLYVSRDGSTDVQRFTLPTLAPDISYSLGSDSFFGPLFALDLQVAPGAPHTSAVALGAFGVSPSAQGPVIVFDDATPRAKAVIDDFDRLQWGADASTLFATSQLSGDLFSLAVTSTGVTQNHDFNSGTGDRGIHFNPVTNLIYSDGGRVVDSSTGNQVGIFDASALMVPDSSVNAAYFLSGGTIQVFDLTRFTLAGSITVPGVIGTPQHLIRWGQNGLAFNTDSGQIFLVAGNAVGPVAGATLTPPPNTPPPPPPTPTAQTPTIASLVPSSAVKNGPAFTLTINGTQFDPAAQVLFNGSARTTTFVSSTQLTATINAADIANVGTANIAVANPVANGGTSLLSTFFIGDSAGTSAANASFSLRVLDQSANDLVYDPVNQLIYLSVPGSAGTQGNTISAIQLSTASVPFAVFAGSEPAVLAISQDSQFLYSSLNGSSKVQRFTLPGLGIDINYPLAADQFGPTIALDLQVAPGAPHTTAVTTGNTQVSPRAEGGISIFDDATARPTKAAGFGGSGGGLFDSIQWGADANTLYAANDDDTGFDFYTLSVNASGITLSNDFPNTFHSFSNAIHFDPVTNLIYADDGQIVNPAGTVVGTFSGSAGHMTPDGALNKAFFAFQASGQSITIQSFNLTTHSLIDSLTIPNTNGNVTGLIRWGTNGLAVSTSGGQVILVAGSFVQ